jgi:hypothetical protein
MAEQSVDVGEYCRVVEDHLTRVNGGHLVRIVGPAFELVRQWALAGIPPSVVFRGIDLKAERHKLGKSTRPLRLEFCEPDVREVYRNWRRALGLFGDEGLTSAVDGGEVTGAANGSGGERAVDAEDRDARRPSLGRHIGRAIERLTGAMARVDVPDDLRQALEPMLERLVELRAAARKLRGAARDEIADRLKTVDEELAAHLQSFAPAAARDAARQEAEAELSSYRSRLPADAWSRAVTANADRLLRDRYGLPTL